MPGILVVAEHVQGAVSDISKEMVGAASDLKTELGGPLSVVALSEKPKSLAASLNLAGVDEVFAIDVGSSHFDPLVYEETVVQFGKELQPRIILFGHTANGMACSAAVAARLGSGYASDVTGIAVKDGEVIATRSAYGNKVNLELAFPGKEVVALTLRGATFTASEQTGNAVITERFFDVSSIDGKTDHIEYKSAPVSDVDISKAEFILSIGRGIQDKDNIPRFAQLADRLGATLGCSRPVVDAGWLPKAHQVGQSGTVASNCKLYISLGISGAVQHLFGMKHVDTIIAVNIDPDAPIFNVASYGANVDLFDLADALERHFN